MSEFPVSLLEILLEPNVTEAVIVREIPTNGITAESSIDVLVRYLTSNKERNNLEKTRLQNKPERPRNDIGFSHPISYYKDSQDIILIGQLDLIIKAIEETTERIRAEVKDLEGKGYVITVYDVLPSSVILSHRRVPSSISFLSLWNHITFRSHLTDYRTPQYHQLPYFNFLKLRPINILSLTMLANNLQEYEGKLVATQGILVGQASNLYLEYSGGFLSSLCDAPVFVLMDKNTGATIRGTYSLCGPPKKIGRAHV